MEAPFRGGTGGTSDGGLGDTGADGSLINAVQGTTQGGNLTLDEITTGGDGGNSFAAQAAKAAVRRLISPMTIPPTQIRAPSYRSTFRPQPVRTGSIRPEPIPASTRWDSPTNSPTRPPRHPIHG